MNRRRVLQTVASGIATTSYASSVNGGLVSSSSELGPDIRKGNSMMIDLKVSIDSDEKLPVVNIDRPNYPTYQSGGEFFYVRSDIARYSPDRPIVRTPFAVTQPRSSLSKFYVGKTVSSNYAGTHAKIVKDDGYFVGNAIVYVSSDAASVKIEDISFSVPSGQSITNSLRPRTVEVPEYAEKTVSVMRNNTRRQTTTMEQIGKKTITVTPKVEVANRGRVSVLGKQNARVFPTDMPGANAMLQQATNQSVIQSSGIAVIKEGDE